MSFQNWMTKLEQTADDIALQRRDAIYNRLWSTLPQSRDVLLAHRDFHVQQNWRKEYAAIMLELSYNEKRLIFSGIFMLDWAGWFERFADTPGRQGQAFLTWCQEHKPNFNRVWHGGFLDGNG